MSNVWDYVTSISETKKDLMSGTENDSLAEKGYDPFLTNRNLSYFPDTILYAQEMNFNCHLGKKPQYYYYINSIRPKKRFSKWSKKTKDNDVEAVKEYYGYNNAKAEAALPLLSPEQLKEIKRRLEKGGKKK